MHSPTLLLAVLILMTLITGVLFFAWLLNKDVDGLREWFGGFLVALVNIALFLAKPPMPPALAVFLLQALFLLTGWMSLLGVYRYLHHPKIPWRPMAWAMASALLLILFLALQAPSPIFSFGLGSILTGLLFLWAARILWGEGSAHYPARRFCGLATCLHGLFLCFRVLLYQGGTFSLMFGHVWWNNAQWIMVEQLIMTPLIGLGILLLINESHLTKLRVLAEEDSLTGIRNRRAFLNALEKACDQARITKQALSVLVMDVDHFKSINDNHGHSTGDEVLKEISAVINACLRQGDVLGRIGGEEFAVFLPDTDRGVARAVAERIRAAVCGRPLTLGMMSMSCSVSIGISVLKAGDSLDEVLRQGDQAMYLAKSNGRNRVECA